MKEDDHSSKVDGLGNGFKVERLGKEQSVMGLMAAGVKNDLMAERQKNQYMLDLQMRMLDRIKLGRMIRLE